MPVAITVNGELAHAYQWRDGLRLMRHEDRERGLTHDFIYGEGRAPVRVVLRGAPDAVHRATGVYTQEVVMNVFTDQVDSVRALVLSDGGPDGQPVKCVEYDSFGNVTADTRPEWRFALGFACGLNDSFTGFIRFGFRDYDPFFGRFTAKDPARDMRGDGDLYDYCVDDPVGRFDPMGLESAPSLPRLPAKESFLYKAGKEGSLTLAKAGIWSAGRLADGAEWLFTGTTARKGSKGADDAIRLLEQKKALEREATDKATKKILPRLVR